MADLQKLSDREKLISLQKQLLEVMETKGFIEEIEDLRVECGSKQQFDKWVQDLVGKKCSAICEEHGVDFEWQFNKVGEFESADEEITKRNKRIVELLTFETLGPLAIQKGDCAEVNGLQSESGKLLNGQKCVIKGYDEAKGRYEVRFVPERLMHIKPDNLRRLDDRERLASILVQALELVDVSDVRDKIKNLREKCGSKGEFTEKSWEFLGKTVGTVFERHGVDMEWFSHMHDKFAPQDLQIAEKHKRFMEITGFGTLGSLDIQKGDCVTVTGLTSPEGKPFNGRTGSIKSYDKQHGLYEVSLPAENNKEKIIHVKANQLEKLDDKGKVVSIQMQMLATLAHPEVKAAIENARAEVANAGEWEGHYGELFGGVCGPIVERHGVDFEWFIEKSGHFAEEDPKIEERGKEIEEFGSFGKLGLLEAQKGDCVEMSGLTAASDKHANGQKGIIKSFDQKSGLYEIRLVPEKIVHVKPANLQILGDRGKLTSMQVQMLQVMDTREVRDQFDQARVQSTNAEKFGEAVEKLLADLQGPIYERHGVNDEWHHGILEHFVEEPVFGIRFRRMQALSSFGGVSPLLMLEKGTQLLVGGFTGADGQALNGQIVIIQGWNEQKSSYDVLLADDLAPLAKGLKHENLRWIPGREFETSEEAKSFQEAIQAAWDKQLAKEELEALKTQNLETEAQNAALRQLVLKVQKPVLERFGFRADFGGQFQLMLAMRPMEEADPTMKQRNVDMHIFGHPT